MKTKTLKEWIFAILFIGQFVLSNNCLAQETPFPSFNLEDNAINSLFLEKKGQIQFLYYTPSLQGSTFQLGYSPFSKVSFDSGVRYTNVKFGDQRGENERKGSNFYFGGGVYHSIFFKEKEKDTKGGSKHLSIQLNFGYSIGKLKTRIGRTSTKFEYDKWFYQLGVGYQLKFWRFDFFTKIHELHFRNGEVSRADYFPEVEEVINTIQEESKFEMRNNKFQISCGFGFIDAVLGVSINKSKTKEEQYFFLKNNAPYFGCKINIDELLKKAKVKRR